MSAMAVRLVACAVIAAFLSAGCRQAATESARTSSPSVPATLSGSLTIGGSSTMFPVSRRMADAFEKAHAGVKVAVSSSATGTGFQALCAGQLDLTGASRPINADELRDCAANRIAFIELPVAFDSLSIVVNSANTFASCLTVAELKRLWEPAAQGTLMRWRQLRSSFPDQPITLVGPGTESGTFDYFTLAIVGAERSSRTDYIKSDDDQVLANTVAADANALGYFGYSYAAGSKTLKVVGVDAGAGCIAPSAASVTDNTYQPLSRPMFLYVNAAAAERPEVREMARAYLAPENARLVSDAGDTPLPIATLLTIARRLDARTTGTIFGGRGAVVGLTPDLLRDEDAIKNALVR
jgi:phosphate transport system substrate-binding protein